jgi:glycosyltransferase involved in cell wall biosynthesis
MEPLHAPDPWTRAGRIMATLLALFITVSALRATFAPASFATAFGLPLHDLADTGFLGVYAIRSAFLCAFTLTLVARRDLRTLSLFAAMACAMPVADALWVLARTGAPAAMVRHGVIGLYLLATALVLRRAARVSAG